MVSLRSLELFAEFSARELAKLEPLCQLRSLPAGEFLFREGDPATAFYVITSGEVEISRTREGRSRRI